MLGAGRGGGRRVGGGGRGGGGVETSTKSNVLYKQPFTYNCNINITV